MARIESVEVAERWVFEELSPVAVPSSFGPHSSTSDSGDAKENRSS